MLKSVNKRRMRLVIKAQYMVKVAECRLQSEQDKANQAWIKQRKQLFCELKRAVINYNK